MRFQILHQSDYQIRIHVVQHHRMTSKEADILQYFLTGMEGVSEAKVYERTSDAIIRLHRIYVPGAADILLLDDPVTAAVRENILSGLMSFRYEDISSDASIELYHGARELDNEFEERFTGLVARRVLRKMFLPMEVRAVIAVVKSLRYIGYGLKSLWAGRLNVSVLDATAISLSLLRGEFSTASSVMFLLRIGELLEDWTRKKSMHDLAATMSLNVEKVWVVSDDGSEELAAIESIVPGTSVKVRMGGLIPLDGKVVGGEAAVNQASMTGESLPVRKKEGSYVYAGTVVEEGELLICVDKALGHGKYDRIVRMIEESEKLKSAAETHATSLADKLVPYSLGGALATYLISGNATRAMAVVMVDFSCAIKLATPIAVLSAMRECSSRGITVKGGRFLENIAEADTIVFDKTGTLTHAVPTVAKIVTFGDADETESLRLAACLEEHFPHSTATAIVNEAKARGITHEEMHGRVDYVVAHGISSTIDSQHVVIGSAHFIFEDEGCILPPGTQHLLDSLPAEYTHIYMAISGVLHAVICIYDPLREDARDVIDELRRSGFSRIVMMTGDNEKTAASIASSVGVDEYFSQVLPEDKAAFIKSARQEGHKVVMVGDGINDSPALSEADAGIAISSGAAIAREISDITISSDDLYTLAALREISTRLMHRISSTQRNVIAFNFGLVALGVAGILPPTTSAVLHNASTIASGIYCMSDLMPGSE